MLKSVNVPVIRGCAHWQRIFNHKYDVVDGGQRFVNFVSNSRALMCSTAMTLMLCATLALRALVLGSQVSTVKRAFVGPDSEVNFGCMTFQQTHVCASTMYVRAHPFCVVHSAVVASDMSTRALAVAVVDMVCLSARLLLRLCLAS
jgi:hypothetical protein